jgi:hypothetical protein
MADNETLAALASQVAELRDLVEQLRRVVTQWEARLEREGIGATLVLRTEVKRLARALDQALSAHRLKPPPAPYWLPQDAADYQGRLAELCTWIDEILRLQYPGYTSNLRPCWVNHPEAIWELSTLMTEWLRIYGDEENRDLAGALVWHERWLPGALARLSKAIPCDELGCRLVRGNRSDGPGQRTYRGRQ